MTTANNIANATSTESILFLVVKSSLGTRSEAKSRIPGAAAAHTAHRPWKGHFAPAALFHGLDQFDRDIAERDKPFAPKTIGAFVDTTRC
jgi:hypothetical protein